MIPLLVSVPFIGRRRYFWRMASFPSAHICSSVNFGPYFCFASSVPNYRAGDAPPLLQDLTRALAASVHQ